jgi:hypothetical protein
MTTNVHTNVQGVHERYGEALQYPLKERADSLITVRDNYELTAASL